MHRRVTPQNMVAIDGMDECRQLHECCILQYVGCRTGSWLQEARPVALALGAVQHRVWSTPCASGNGFVKAACIALELRARPVSAACRVHRCSIRVTILRVSE
jgi:hypothetical protein